MEKSVVIVAGGHGMRMGTVVPKQFLLIAGLPVLMHTINAFRKQSDINIILVLPKDHMEEWKVLCQRHHFEYAHQVAAGGSTRFQSVKNGIQLAPKNGLVGIHDGVRPFVSQNLIAECFSAAKQFGAVVPAVKPIESIRQVKGQTSRSVDRNEFVLVQTPQVFKSKILINAYKQDEKVTFTDDASVVESEGHPIHVVEGDFSNIKITTPADLAIAEVVIKDFL